MDQKIIEGFKARVEEDGVGSYQSLHDDVHSQEKEPLEETFRRVISEELHS